MRKDYRINAIVAASPHKSVASELEMLRKTFREVVRRYTERVDSEIIRLREKVIASGALADNPKAAPRPLNRIPGAPAETARSQLRDVRDMLMLLRALEVKPAEGRRKDLKKIDTIVEDLRLLAERWE